MINHSQHHSEIILISWESKFGPNNTDANRVGASTDSVAVNTRPLGFFSRSLGQGCTTLVLRSWWWGLLLHKLGNDDDDRIRFFQVNWNTHTKYSRERPTTSRPSCTRLCKTLSFVPYTLSNILPTLCGITNPAKDSHTRPAVKRGGYLLATLVSGFFVFHQRPLWSWCSSACCSKLRGSPFIVFWRMPILLNSRLLM